MMTFDRNLIADIRDWLFAKALPFWADAGVDRAYGGFVEELEFSGADAGLPYKRVRVSCRQVYVFAHASLLGWTDGARLVDQGAAFLIDKAWQGEDAGFAHKLARDGSILDPTADLYEQAFALFAFAYAFKATGRSDYLQWAHKTLDYIETHLRDNDAGDGAGNGAGDGFWHNSNRSGHRLQNPHMHLAEASIAAFDATGDARFAGLAKDLAGLFQRRLFNRNAGTLTEYFERDWTVAGGAEGRIVEPGHQLEWAWILQQMRSRFGVGEAETIRRLVRFAETCGLNPETGAVMNRVDIDGTPIDAGSRSWPNTERIKAALALYELDGEDPRGVVNAAAGLLFERYLSSAPGAIDLPAGAWIDAFDHKGQPLSTRIPASILYHFFLAFAEILRLEKADEKTPTDH